MSTFNTGDRVRVTDSPFEAVVPNGSVGVVVETDFGIPGGVFVKLDDLPLPNEFQAMAIAHGFPESNMWPMHESELEVAS